MFNKIIMMGNLTRDVELRYLPSGSAVATLGLASNRRYKKQDGTQAEEVCFIDVKLFGRTAEVANQYLRKGSKVLIEGKLTLESWTDQQGNKKSRHTITAENMQMLDTRQESTGDYSGVNNSYSGYSGGGNGGGHGNSYPQKNTPAASQTSQYESNIPEINIDDDEIPF